MKCYKAKYLIIKRILLVVFSQYCLITIHSQDKYTAKNIEFDGSNFPPGGKYYDEYVGRDGVSLLPGFSYDATTDAEPDASFYTDEDMVLPVDYLTDQQVQDLENREIDKSLPVGSI